MPASKPQDIRNIVFLGHGGAGKTTLAEAILYQAKVTTRLGSVNDGTSMLDYSDIEKDRQHTVDPVMASVDHAGKTLNMIDAPGYPDFIGGALSVLPGGDIAAIVVSATAGIEVNTRRLFRAAQDAGMAVMFVINKIDSENIDLSTLLDQIGETFGSACKVLNLPADGNKSVVDCFTNDSGSADFGDVGDAHTQLTENIIEADEELMEAYLGGEEIPADKLQAAFSQAMTEGTVIPIMFTAAREEIGVIELMDAAAKYFPAPSQSKVTPAKTSTEEDAQEITLEADAAKPFVGHAFKITADPFVGKLAWIRVIQGTATPDTTYHLRDDKKANKIGHLFKLQGKDTKEVKSAVAGELVVLAKVEEIQTGDVLHEEATPMYMDHVSLPTPMYSLAITPKSRGDETKISGALARLAEEDHTFVSMRDSQTHETVISGIGDLHLRLMLEKMKQRFDLEVDTKPPKIPYRETITCKAEGHHRHKKQTGGSGQFGEVYLRVEPLERGAGFEFSNDLFGESIPRQYLPAIEKGIRDVLSVGPIAGYQMQDIKVSVYDGKHHPVDSKEIAFRSAGKTAFIEAVKNAKPVLLEPIVDLEVTIPAAFMGDITSDLAGRRGRIQGQDMLPGNMCVIKAQTPLSEVMQYNSQLRSVTGGQGSYAMELSHFEPVPGNVQQQIIAAATKTEEEEK